MTKYKNAIAIAQAMIISSAMITALKVAVSAQGLCIPEPLIVTVVSGKVVSQLEKGDAPLPQATVVLLEDRYEGHVIAETTSRPDGFFEFSKKVKPGKYVLKVTHPNLAAFYGRVRVTASKARTPQQEILVTIGADFTKPCGGSFAELREKKDR